MKALIESDSVGFINITQQRTYIWSVADLLHWNLYTDVESPKEVHIRSIEVTIKQNLFCRLPSLKSLICGINKKSREIIYKVNM